MTVRRAFIATGVILWVLLAAGIVDGVSAGSPAANPAGDPARPLTGRWPEDVDGDGVVSDRGGERIPEFIRAVGDHGTEGYVRYEDLEGPQPSSPTEAIAMSGEPRTIPLYGADLVHVIGTYTLSSGDPAEGPVNPDGN